MAKKQITIEDLTTAIARWQTRLRRAVRAIEKLEQRKKRLVKALAKPPVARSEPAVPAPPPPAPAPAPSLAETIMREIAAPVDTTLPDFLRRKKLDPVAEQIVAEQSEIKRLKARGRIAKMKAKQSGETTKMPLTGKAALAAIRG